MNCKMLSPIVAVCALLVQSSLAQSLFREQPAPPKEEGVITTGTSQTSGTQAAATQPDAQEQLRATSLTMVEAPKPRDFQIHDTVSIIIQETSRQSSTAKLDTKKDASIKGKINKLPELTDLLELMLDTTDTAPLVEVGADGALKFKGDGKYERSERLSDRIQATIIDVKPNGTLVLEARRSIGKDQEVQTLVLSGVARREDVTNANSVLSSQLAELTIKVQSEGDVKDTASKGFFTRLFEAVFNF